MSHINESQKKERLKVIDQVRIYIKRYEYKPLQTYLNNINFDNKLIKNFNEKKTYIGDIHKSPRGQLENSKDRMTFLNKLITSQTNGYNPIKKFMDRFNNQYQKLREQRSKERTNRLKYLRKRQLERHNNTEGKTPIEINTERVNKARIHREKLKKRKLEKALIKKKKNNVINPNYGKQPGTEFVKISKEKTTREERVERMLIKDGDINKNIEFLLSGFYKLPTYEKAMVFKFTMDFENVVKDKVIEILDDKGNLLIHCNIRSNNTFVINNHIDDKWGNEIRITREMKGKHIIKILVKNEYFKISEDNKLISFLLHKNNTKSSFININDNVRNFIYKVM